VENNDKECMENIGKTTNSDITFLGKVGMEKQEYLLEKSIKMEP
jgi:hypothetical protein